MDPARNSRAGAGRGSENEMTPLLDEPALTWTEIVRFCVPYIVPLDTKHRVLAIVSISAVILGKILALAPPLIMSYVVDHIAEGGEGSLTGTLWALFLFFVASAGVTGLAMLQKVSNSYVSSDARRRFSVDLYKHLVSLSLSYHLKQRSGKVMSMMGRATSSVTMLTNVFLFNLMPTLFETILVTLVFFKLGQPSVAIAILVSVVFYFSFTIAVTSWRAKIRRGLNDAENNLSDKTHETLTNLESVKVFQKDEQEVADYEAKSIAFRDASVEITSSLEILNAGQGFIRLLGLFAGLCIAAYGTVYGNPRVTPGTFVSINLFILQLFQVGLSPAKKQSARRFF